MEIVEMEKSGRGGEMEVDYRNNLGHVYMC